MVFVNVSIVNMREPLHNTFKSNVYFKNLFVLFCCCFIDNSTRLIVTRKLRTKVSVVKMEVRQEPNQV